MKINTKRTSIQLFLTEEEAQVISAGLCALRTFVFDSQGMFDLESDEFRLKHFAYEKEPVTNSLLQAFGEHGHWPEPVCRAMTRYAAYEEMPPLSEAEILRLQEERSRSEEERRRRNVADRGLAGMSPEGELVLNQLSQLAWPDPDNWVPATCNRSGKGTRDKGHDRDGVWLLEIEFLVGVGRIIPQVKDGKEGWIVPSADEWRATVRRRRRSIQNGEYSTSSITT